MRELTEDLLKEIYDEMLDECSGSECSMCESYGRARILAEIDPVAYRCGMVDFQDGLETFDCAECKETFLLENDSAEDESGGDLARTRG